MIHLVVGGSGSGKSEYAEKISLDFNKKLYIATMQPFTDETLEKIKRHQLLRKDKNFDSIDCYFDIGDITINNYDVVLLECLGNLVANEMYRDNNFNEQTFCYKTLALKIIDDILKINKKIPNLIIVSNNVFCDSFEYSQETICYIKTLGEINKILSTYCEYITELVCLIPIKIK